MYKRQVEYTFLNGVYSKATSVSTVNKTRGMLEPVSYTHLNEMTKWFVGVDFGWEHYGVFVLIGKTQEMCIRDRVVHGRWIGKPLCGNDNCRCSICGSWFNVHASLRGDITQIYCPNCGAKMDLDTANDTQHIYEAALNKWGKENQTCLLYTSRCV